MKDLIYVGAGRFLVGIPATDLTVDQVAELAEQRGLSAAELLALLSRSGIYSVKPSKPAPQET